MVAIDTITRRMCRRVIDTSIAFAVEVVCYIIIGQRSPASLGLQLLGTACLFRSLQKISMFRN